MHALVSSRNGQLFIVVERIPVVLGRMAAVPTPLQVAASHVAFHYVLHHSARQQGMQLALEEGEVQMERRLGRKRVVEDGLLVCLAPAVSPAEVHALHIHPATTTTTTTTTNVKR